MNQVSWKQSVLKATAVVSFAFLASVGSASIPTTFKGALQMIEFEATRDPFRPEIVLDVSSRVTLMQATQETPWVVEVKDIRAAEQLMKTIYNDGSFRFDPAEGDLRVHVGPNDESLSRYDVEVVGTYFPGARPTDAATMPRILEMSVWKDKVQLLNRAPVSPF